MIKAKLIKFLNYPYVAEFSVFLGGIICFFQAWQYVHMKISSVDEGGYSLSLCLEAKLTIWIFHDLINFRQLPLIPAIPIYF